MIMVIGKVFAEAVIDITLINVGLAWRQCRLVPEKFIFLPVGLDGFSKVAFCPGNKFNFFGTLTKAINTTDPIWYRNINLQGAEKVRTAHAASFLKSKFHG
jgi:hypothetical protein